MNPSIKGRVAALLLATVLAACGTTARDPKLDARYRALHERIQRDREEIGRQISALEELDPVRRARRLHELDAALSSLFGVQSQAFDASADGEPEALQAAETTLRSVEDSIARGRAPR